MMPRASAWAGRAVSGGDLLGDDGMAGRGMIIKEARAAMTEL